jgi:hypothetical protein
MRLLLWLALLAPAVASADAQDEAALVLRAGYEAYGPGCGFDRAKMPKEDAAAVAYLAQFKPCVLDKIRAFYERESEPAKPSFLENLGQGLQDAGTIMRPSDPARSIDFRCANDCRARGYNIELCNAKCSY